MKRYAVDYAAGPKGMLMEHPKGAWVRWENATALQAEIERLQAIVAELPGWADALVDAQNQLHGIRHTGMAKRNVRDVEEAIREAAEAARGVE